MRLFVRALNVANLALVLAVVVTPSIITGCAAAVQGGAATAADQITEADIAKANVATAYDAVDRLARRWFRDLSGNTAGEVAVYLSTDQQLGGKDSLREIPARDVLTLRYLKSADAMARYGPSASGGAIIVTRR
jgi:hypothetical protein